MTAARLRDAGLAHWVWTVGRSRPMDWLRRLNARPIAAPSLSAQNQLDLQRIFAPDVQALEDLLRQNLRTIWFDYTRLAPASSVDASLRSSETGL